MTPSISISEIKARFRKYVKNLASNNGLYITRIYPEHLDATPIALQRLKNQGFHPTAILDVGAASGTWTIDAMQVYPSAHYLLVEPRDDRKPKLAALQSQYERITLSHDLVGAAPGMVTFYVQGDQSTVFPTAGDQIPAPQRTVKTLDSILEDLRFPAPQLIKLDIQGSELLALQGAPHALRAAAYVTMEISFVADRIGWNLAHEVIQFMAANHYMIHDIYELARDERNIMYQCMMTFKNHQHETAS